MFSADAEMAGSDSSTRPTAPTATNNSLKGINNVIYSFASGLGKNYSHDGIGIIPGHDLFIRNP